MTIRADVEDIQTTRTEKFLAVVFTAFLLLGGIWTYTRIDDLVRDHVEIPQAAFQQNDPAIVARSDGAAAPALRPRLGRASRSRTSRSAARRTAPSLDAGETAPLSSAAVRSGAGRVQRRAARARRGAEPRSRRRRRPPCRAP